MVLYCEFWIERFEMYVHFYVFAVRNCKRLYKQLFYNELYVFIYS